MLFVILGREAEVVAVEAAKGATPPRWDCAPCPVSVRVCLHISRGWGRGEARARRLK